MLLLLVVAAVIVVVIDYYYIVFIAGIIVMPIIINYHELIPSNYFFTVDLVAASLRRDSPRAITGVK